MELISVGIPVGNDRVSGLLLRPPVATAMFLFAHGAGVGMNHPVMAGTADGLASRGIGTFRYQFPYMEKGGGRPDPPSIAQSTVRAAAAMATQLVPDLPLFAGGRSYGGRMTSQAQAQEPLARVRGIAFLGFPLHPAGAPAVERAGHLASIRVPMLFVSGDHDALADVNLLNSVVADLGEKATLHLIAHGDHGFRVPVRSGRTLEEAQTEALDVVARWMKELS